MQDASSSATPHDELPADLAALRALVLEQRALLDTQRAAIAALQQDRDQWRRECEAYQAWLKRVNQARFGRRSEQFDPRQLLLQFPADPAVAATLAEALEEATVAAREALEDRAAAAARQPRRRRAAASGEFPAHLPRIVETTELPADAQLCPRHGPKKLIGFDQTETLEIIPPKLQVRQRRYPKYVCQQHAECGVTQPPREPALVAGNRFDISVAVAVILHKFAYYLPLYRQQDLFAACGWTPSRSTLNNLLAATDPLLMPLDDFLGAQTLAGGVLGADDTTVTLVTPPFAPEGDANDPRALRTREVLADAIAVGRPSVTARFWAYRSLTTPLNYFDFTVSRHRDGPADVLGKFRGLLLGDCYAGFESIALARDREILLAACWAHARRKFVDIQADYPIAAARMLALIRRLYDIEDQARAFSPEQRRALRQAESRPVLDKIRALVFEETQASALPKSRLYEALHYVGNNWNELLTFLQDGRCPLDNNDCEQLMKQIAIGRNNWLFVGSVAAGQRAARLMTLVSSARRNELDIERYLTDVLRQLLAGSTDYHALLPQLWREAHPDAVRTYREDERRDAIDRQTHRRAERRQHKPVSGELTPEEQARLIAKAKAKLLGQTERRPRRRSRPDAS